MRISQKGPHITDELRLFTNLRPFGIALILNDLRQFAPRDWGFPTSVPVQTTPGIQPRDTVSRVIVESFGGFLA